MAKKLLILFLLFLPLTIGIIALSHCPPSSFSDQPLPLWWEIRIILESEGNYKVNELKSSYSGHYSFTSLWKGYMERDNGDYLLYYEDTELIRFEAEEKGILPKSIQILSTEDFNDKPFFKLNYILRKDLYLHFDIIAKGFLIPQNKSENKFYLNLPASEENSRNSSEIDYNLFVYNGSNRIFLEEQEIYLKTVEEKFAWDWKYQRWHKIQNKPIFFNNSHKAKIKISIKPHFKKTTGSLAIIIPHLRKAFAMLDEIRK